MQGNIRHRPSDDKVAARVGAGSFDKELNAVGSIKRPSRFGKVVAVRPFRRGRIRQMLARPPWPTGLVHLDVKVEHVSKPRAL